MWSPLIWVVIVSASICGLWLFLQFQAEAVRRKRLALRHPLEFDDWFYHYYGDGTNVDKALAKEVLAALGEAFRIEPTNFLPTDRIRDDLSLDAFYTLDDVWELFEIAAKERLGRQFEWKRGWITVDDLIRGICSRKQK